MTERKPANLSFQSWVERQIVDAADRGEFDGLDGHGKPLADVDRPRDELWWVRQKLRREGVDYVPPALAIRKTHDEAILSAAASSSEAEVRSILESLNAEIRYLNSHTVSGPPTTIGPVDVEEFVDRWRAARDQSHVEPSPDGEPTPPPQRPRRWSRIRRR